jgi:hypothetical protein
MTSSLTKNLVRHLSITREGEIEDRTAHSTMTVLGMPPELRLTGDCDVLLYLVDSRCGNLPMYLAGSLAGYRTPTMALQRRSPDGMHPDLIKYYSPFQKEERYKYMSPPRAPDNTSGEVSISLIRNAILARYLSGAFIVGSGNTDYKSPRTISAARSWARTYVSPRRGLCALASSTIAVVVGDESCLEACGLGSNGLLEIASTAGLHEAYSEYDFEKVRVDSDVMHNVRLDASKVTKAAKPDGLMVEYMKCDSLKEVAFNVPYLLNAYWHQNLVAGPPTEEIADINAWEIRRQLNLFSQSYSWECNLGAGKSASDSSYMRRGCYIPQYLLERLSCSKPLQVEGSVEVYQRTLKERRRNRGITYRTSGAKKAAEREYIKVLEEEVLTLRSLEVDYRLWRASLDSITGTVPAEWQDPTAHSGYDQISVLAGSDDLRYSNTGNGIIHLFSQVNYCERQGMLAAALPIYSHIMYLASINSDGLPYPSPFNGQTVKASIREPLGMGMGNHSRKVVTPYDSVRPGRRWGGCEELLYPWVGLRVEEIAAELGVDLSDAMRSTIEAAKTGCLVSEENPFCEYFKLLALEDGLY